MLDTTNVGILDNNTDMARVLINIANPFWYKKDIEMVYSKANSSNILLGFAYEGRDYQLAIQYNIFDVKSIDMYSTKNKEVTFKRHNIDNHIGVYKKLIELGVIGFIR